MLITSYGPSFGEEVLPSDSKSEHASTPSKGFDTPETFSEALMELEIKLLKDALRKAKFNQRKASRVLGLTYHQFRGLYRKHKDKLK